MFGNNVAKMHGPNPASLAGEMPLNGFKSPYGHHLEANMKRLLRTIIAIDIIGHQASVDPNPYFDSHLSSGTLSKQIFRQEPDGLDTMIALRFEIISLEIAGWSNRAACRPGIRKYQAYSRTDAHV